MKISDILREWYKINARDLPWRQTQDPYLIWISEVILQQTQVKQGIGYYIRFAEKFPDVRSLSAANEEEVLRLWQGLGYYSRARNLLTASRQVVSEYDGRLPDNFRHLKNLKGIGEYTAAAIASIAFKEPVPAVDGNVSRVICRVFGIDIPANSPAGKKLIREAACGILDKTDPGNSNQAVIEFGALQCRPSNPDCLNCILSAICKAFHDGTVDRIPVKTVRKRIRDRWFNFFIITWKDSVVIEKRNTNDIWRSLFQFPMIETQDNLPEEKILAELLKPGKYGIPGFILSKASGPVIHQLTHQRITARFFHLELNDDYLSMPKEWIMVQRDKLDEYPIPRLIEKYLQEMEMGHTTAHFESNNYVS